MANTAVKDVSSLFLKQAVPAAGKAAAGNGDFHKVWSSQMNKGASNSATSDSNSQKQNKINEQGRDSFQEKTPVQKSDGAEPKDVQSVNPSKGNRQEEAVSGGGDTTESAAEQVSGTDAAEEGEFEIAADVLQNVLNTAEMQGQEAIVLPDVKPGTAEGESGVTQKQLMAMEILGTAVAQFMEQITDVFGVTMEELQSAMESLEMEPADLLDASKLGGLLLELGGAKDAYALITDGALYDNYRMVMEQLEQVLQESAGELGTDPEQLSVLLKDSMQAVQEAETSADASAEKVISPGEEALTVTEEDASPVSGMQADTIQEEPAEPKQDTGAQERNGRQPEGRADREDYLNFFTQDFRAEQFRSGLQQVQEASQDSPWSTDTRQIMDQILDYMKLNLNADTTSLEMQLHPASLGTLHVQIASKGGIVTANFITENEAVKAALESQMMQLREQFEEQGVKIEAIEVTVQTHEFEQNLEQGRGRSQQEGEKGSRSRRFRMDGVASMDSPEAEDAAEADRMAAGGSTVSYTA